MHSKAARGFDLQLFAILGNGGNGFPADIQDILTQKNFLQTFIRKAIAPKLVFRPKKVAPEDYFQARVGETKTFTRRGLIAPNGTPLNPANNTGFDNGMTADVRVFEQWTATLNEWASFIPTNLLAQEVMLADQFLDNNEAEAQKGASSLELVCVDRLFQAYDSGDTFVTGAGTGVSVNLYVDNINGFDTQYPFADAPSYKAPGSTSTTNYVPIVILDATNGLIKAIVNCNLATPDVSNVSCMQGGGQAFGRSGLLTLSATTASRNIGDRVVAIDPGYLTSATPPTIGGVFNPVWKDSAVIIRPLNNSNTPIGTAYAIQNTNIVNPSVMIPAAVAVLKRRHAPKLPNGLYGCAIDSTLLSQFYQDTGFQRATATNWDRGRYFTDGVIAAGWGVEFTEATQLPTYGAPAGGFNLRHAFVFGADVISEHPYIGARNAADIVAQVGDIADERWVDRIKFRNVAALDTLGQVIKTAYDYVGDFQAGTDKSSNPTIVFTSDWCRYKRGIVVQAAAPF